MKKLLAVILAVLTALPVEAALPNTTTWEVRQAGSSTNSGCFIAGASGTDWSQQNAAHQTYTDLTRVTATTITSAAHPFGATDVGNCIRVSSGTGCTVGVYQIVSVLVVTATVDRTIGTASCVAGHAQLGGAINGPGQLATDWSTSGCSGCIAWVKADATYTTSTQVVLTFAGTPGNQVNGYTTSRGDNGSFTLQATGAIAGTRIITIANIGFLRNIILDVNSQINTGGLEIQAFSYAENVEIKNSNAGQPQLQIDGNGTQMCRFCWVHDGVSGGNVISLLGSASDNQQVCWQCTVYNMTGANTVGFSIVDGTCLYCTVAALTSATSIGFVIVPSGGVAGAFIDHCVVYNVTSDAIQIQNISISPVIQNCVFDTAVNGINNTSGTTLRAGDVYNDYNFTYNLSGAAVVNLTAGSHSQALGTDPFVSPSTRNFALNNTAGGGGTVNNGGTPTSLPGVTGIGYPAGGGLQPKVISGGGSSVVP